MAEPLLHLTTAAPWRVALDAGTLVTPSLVGPEGFIHLSTPEQVHLPANRLYAGRDDLLLLVIDPQRLDAEIRWEPGVPADPDSMRFPHLYGPLPVAAVTSVVPWRPGPAGFTPPQDLPDPGDTPARARAFDPGLSQRRAAAVLDVDGGFAVLDPRIRASHEHNCLWLYGEQPTHRIREIADEVLRAYPYRRAVLDTPPPPDLGWEVDEERLMVLDPRGREPHAGSVEVVPVAHEVIARSWTAQWRVDLPTATEAEIAELVGREPFADAHLRVIDLAVLEGGTPVASAQLRIDGATAALEAVMTRADRRGRGLADAVVADAIRRAARAGCDLLFLSAAADDWPRQWYARLGFTEAGTRWVVTRS